MIMNLIARNIVLKRSCHMLLATSCDSGVKILDYAHRTFYIVSLKLNRMYIYIIVSLVIVIDSLSKIYSLTEIKTLHAFILLKCLLQLNIRCDFCVLRCYDKYLSFWSFKQLRPSVMRIISEMTATSMSVTAETGTWF